MASTQTQKFIGLGQIAEHLGVSSLRISGGERLSTQVKTIETDDLTQAELDAALDSYTYDPEWRPTAVERSWRSKMQQEIDWLRNEINTAPAPGTTTSGNAVVRLDAVIQHLKRLDRDLLWLAEFVRDGKMDAAE